MTPIQHRSNTPPGATDAPAVGLLARFCKARRGATAVEFAMVAMPFLFMLFSILELAAVFLVTVSLESATSIAARQLRTGQVIAAGVASTTSSGVYEDATDFKNSICANMSWIPSGTCLSALQLDVRSYSSFENQTQPSPLSGTTFNTSNLCYYSGNSSSAGATTNTIVLVRAYYMWPLMTQFLNGGLMNVTQVMNGSTVLSSGHMVAIEAAEVFKNEPFSATNTDAGTC